MKDKKRNCLVFLVLFICLTVCAQSSDKVKAMRNLRDYYFAHTQDGLLREGVYNFGRNMGINEPNLWGDYFYFEALVRLSRVWTPYFC